MLNENGNIEYQFPDFYINNRFFFEMHDVLFQDINNDNKTDVIVFACFVMGHGENSAYEMPNAIVFFQKDGAFVNIDEVDMNIPLLSKDMHAEQKYKKRESVLKYLESIQDEIEQMLNNNNYNKDREYMRNVEVIKLINEKEHRF